ncbi:hypothetical protein GCM10011352_04870 [Marinobacterium zhoushanense]|uniref:Inovirus Gp2 family protein n=1 Tax=Marinobacterium zhoushanense TaxID=1679163 RepID=A0ABQ1JY69_9GAMM|nr:hypothetical protein [Marinobacterium zhoushanense]GGB82088.1 hypothetical protein GCM10011352_04870 [Marinobacterium zhoushanense]
MARPLKPIFEREEIERFIQPTLSGVLRMNALKVSEKIKTSEEGFLRNVLSAESLVLKLSHQNAPPGFQVRGEDPLMSIDASHELLRLGADWRGLNAILNGGDKKGDSEPERKIMPRFLAFYESFEPLMRKYSGDLTVGGGGYFSNVFVEEFGFLLKKGFDEFQLTIRSQEIATATKRLQTRINRNRLQQQRYLDSLLESYGDLYVVYLNLGYDIYQPRRSYNAIRRDFEYFMKERRHNPLWKDDLAGFLWKLSDGVERGYHYHLILFYRGDRVEQHLQDKRLLSDKWVKETTEGVGAWFEQVLPAGQECDFLLPDGIVSCEGGESYERLIGFIHYLNKLDYLIQLEVPKGANVYGRGQIAAR